MKKAHWTEAYPHLLKEWHPTKNAGITPKNTKMSDRVWWILPYDDPETGKHFDFEWQAYLAHRIRGVGCPYLSGRAVWVGFNDLATKRPDLAAQWHPTKNGELTPERVTCGCGESVWWWLPFDDPATGKHFDFEWQTTINSRFHGSGCPYLSGRAVWVGYNDLATKQPDLAAQWHPTKNGELTPEKVTCSSNDNVYWLLPFDDPVTGRHFDFEWQATINSRFRGMGCPYLSGKAVWVGYNDLATRRPDLAAQWHPTKNGELTPEKVTYSSGESVWWLLPFDDPATGKHFDFEWQSTISNRFHGSGCPYLSGHAVWTGFNDLATRRPDLAAQWHPTKNDELTPEKVIYSSGESVWWLLPFDDPATGKHFDFEWHTSIYERVRGAGCPFLSGNAVWPGFNDLETCAKMIAKEWHYEKNKKKKPDQIHKYESGIKRWWICRRCGYEWRATVYARVVKNVTCPECRRNQNHFE